MRIATGEAEDVKTTPDPAKEHMRRGGLKGGASQEAVEGQAERHRQEGGPDALGQGRPEWLGGPRMAGHGVLHFLRDLLGLFRRKLLRPLRTHRLPERFAADPELICGDAG